MTDAIREPAVAGTFYPATAARLEAFLDRVLALPPASPWPVRGLLVPHAGYDYSGETAGRGFASVKGECFRRAIILAPSHRVGFRGLSVAPYAAYATPLGQVTVDRSCCASLLACSELFCAHAEVHREEHALEVQLPFLQRVMPEGSIVPLVCGEMDSAQAQTVAEALLPHWDGETLLVMSSDFTHYGPRFRYSPFPEAEARERLAELDGGAIQCVLDGDLEGFTRYVDETGATICGRVPIAVMIAMAAGRPKRRVHYTTSGERTGDYANCVSYACVTLGGAPR